MNKNKGNPAFWDKFTRIMIIIAAILILISAVVVSRVDAHDLHLSNLQEQLGPLVAGPNWVPGMGAVCATEGYNGGPDLWWLLYKDMDLHHSGVHAKPLTLKQAEELLKVND